MYDNKVSDDSERECRESGLVCIRIGYLAVIAAIIAGIIAFYAFTAGLITNTAVILLGALAVVVLLSIVLLALVNIFLIRQEQLCCCAKQRAIWFIVSAIITVIAVGLFFGVGSLAALFAAIAVAFFVLTVLLFIGFYQCFLKCYCNTCDNNRCNR